jgi:hypothetical protein
VKREKHERHEKGVAGGGGVVRAVRNERGGKAWGHQASLRDAGGRGEIRGLKPTATVGASLRDETGRRCDGGSNRRDSGGGRSSFAGPAL